MFGASGQKSLTELFGGRNRYTMGTPRMEIRPGIPHPTIGVSVFSGFNIQRHPNASSTRTQYTQRHVAGVH